MGDRQGAGHVVGQEEEGLFQVLGDKDRVPLQMQEGHPVLLILGGPTLRALELDPCRVKPTPRNGQEEIRHSGLAPLHLDPDSGPDGPTVPVRDGQETEGSRVLEIRALELWEERDQVEADPLDQLALEEVLWAGH